MSKAEILKNQEKFKKITETIANRGAQNLESIAIEMLMTGAVTAATGGAGLTIYNAYKFLDSLLCTPEIIEHAKNIYYTYKHIDEDQKLELYGNTLADMAFIFFCKGNKKFVAEPKMNRTLGLALVEAVGEKHHLLSNKIMRELNKHQTLQGIFNRNDPKFLHRALDKETHKGYQKWHREYDTRVVNWLKDEKYATPEKFINMINKLHQESWVKDRIPNVNL